MKQLWADYVVMDRAYEGEATRRWVRALGAIAAEASLAGTWSFCGRLLYWDARLGGSP